jgi:excisionase family DNA binding protein
MPTRRDDDNEVLNLSEAARFIRVSEKTLGEMARNNRVPCQKVGREWRFLRWGLEQWLAGPPGLPGVFERAAAYRQQELFPDAAAADGEETRRGFGDTAFTKNRREPLHRWVPWIAGFSAAFVEKVFDAAISQDPGEVLVLDPFAGVGTTLVEGLKRGYNVVGFEINPYAALACDVKLHSARCSLSQLAEAINRVEELRRRGMRKASPVSNPPRDFRSKTPFFSPAIEREVLLLQDFIAGQRSAFVKKVLKVALGAVMVGFSNYSYEPSLSTRSAAGKDDVEYVDVVRVFRDKLREIEADIGFLQRLMKRFEHRPSAKVYRHSYLGEPSVLAARSVDVLVTSPPYLNNYHYVRNTRPQLYWLGLVDGNGDLKRLEEESFGRFWQTVRAAPPVELSFELPELREVLGSIRERNPEKGTYGGRGWANYAATYFNDCDRFFRVTRRVMKPGGWVVVVIGNNIVQGIHVETDRFLAQIGELHGFRLAGMHRVRKKRTGSSIVNSSVRAGVARKPTELYETAVELRAPE